MSLDPSVCHSTHPSDDMFICQATNHLLTCHYIMLPVCPSTLLSILCSVHLTICQCQTICMPLSPVHQTVDHPHLTICRPSSPVHQTIHHHLTICMTTPTVSKTIHQCLTICMPSSPVRQTVHHFQTICMSTPPVDQTVCHHLMVCTKL